MAVTPNCLVEVELASGKAHVTKLYSTYPIRIIQQKVSASCIYLVAMGFGGGLVQGDRIDFELTVGKDCQTCFKTQGSTKVFKTDKSTPCPQNISCRLNENSLLVYVPDPTTCFDDSKFKQTSDFDLHNSASLIYVDWFTSGRLFRDKFWGPSQLDNELSIRIDNQIMLYENQSLRNDKYGSVSNKVGGATVFGVLVLIGEQTRTIRARLAALQRRPTYRSYRSYREREARSTQKDCEMHNNDSNTSSSVGDDGSGRNSTRGMFNGNSAPCVSVSNLPCRNGDTMCMVRFSAESVQEVYELLAEILRPTGDLVGTAGLHPYKERCCSVNDKNPSSSSDSLEATTRHPEHPISLLQVYDKAAAEDCDEAFSGCNSNNSVGGSSEEHGLLHSKKRRAPTSSE